MMAFTILFEILSAHCDLGTVPQNIAFEYKFHISYLHRISTARRPIAQANRKGDAPG